MMAMRLCGKHRIASKYCGFIRYQHTKTRKELIPLIKLLHPDLLGHCSDEVRKQNMSCVQSLNDMWDTLEANIESLVGKSLTNGLDIKVPFRPLYDLTCFLKDASPAATDTRENETEASTNHTEADSIQMVKMPFVIRIPEDLCRKQSVSYKVFSSGIDRVLIQQGLLFMHAGLDNPWKSAAAMGQDGSRSKAHRNEEEGQNALSGELELQLFERWMSRSSLQRDAEGGSVDRRGRSRLSQAFNTQHNTRGATPKVDSSFGNRQVTLSYYEDEVDAFIQRGNLMVAALTPAQEFSAVKEARRFLIDFGDVLRFSASRWGRVVLVMYRYEGEEKFQSSRRKSKREGVRSSGSSGGSSCSSGSCGGSSNGSSSGSSRGGRGAEQMTMNSGGDGEENDEYVSSSSSSRARPSAGGGGDTVTNGGYVMEVHGQHHIVKAPHDFKVRHLLEFVGATLPVAKMPF